MSGSTGIGIINKSKGLKEIGTEISHKSRYLTLQIKLMQTGDELFMLQN